VHATTESALTRAEILRWRSWVAMSLCQLQHCNILWSPSRRRLLARSAHHSLKECFKSAKGRPALPPDAVLVGNYAHGIPARYVIDDLLALLERLASEPPAPAPEPEPPPAIAQPKPILETHWTWARRPFNAPLPNRDE